MRQHGSLIRREELMDRQRYMEIIEERIAEINESKAKQARKRKQKNKAAAKQRRVNRKKK